MILVVLLVLFFNAFLYGTRHCVPAHVQNIIDLFKDCHKKSKKWDRLHLKKGELNSRRR